MAVTVPLAGGPRGEMKMLKNNTFLENYREYNVLTT